MNLIYYIYNFIGKCGYIAFVPFVHIYTRLVDKKNPLLAQRFGIYEKNPNDCFIGSPRIWFHAASMGEVNVAEAIIHSLLSLMPDCGIILSTMTQHGYDFALSKNLPQTRCVLAPIDFPQAVQKTLDRFKPEALVCLETEIWPNWLVTAKKLGIKTALINGRLSGRSIRKYMKIRPLIKNALNQIDRFSMIHSTDASRIALLGAPKDRISITGNAKYDRLSTNTDPMATKALKVIFGLKGNEPVLVAGSTWGSEEAMILSVYQSVIQSFPETLLILAPRHVSRTPQIETLIKERGFKYQVKSDLDKKDNRRTAPIIIINTMGELQGIYSLASVVFCGGSLEPLGGQNPLEAAIWGKPVLFGPHMDDVLDAKELLVMSGGGIQVRDVSDLIEKTTYLLNHPDMMKEMGNRAKTAVLSHKGTAGKHAKIICQLVSEKKHNIDQLRPDTTISMD